jgi:hypothetical protein
MFKTGVEPTKNATAAPPPGLMYTLLFLPPQADARPRQFKIRLAVRRATVRPSCHILLANLGGTLSSG